MNHYGALGDARGKRSPYLQHPLGSRVGSLAPFGCMSGFRPTGRSSGPVALWIRQVR